jgi:hypothetical protein
MDSLCANLILDVFQFVRPDDCFRFITLSRKCHTTISNYIASPEWIYEQIDQFIKKNVVVDFSVRNDAPVEYSEQLRKHNRDKRHCDDEHGSGSGSNNTNEYGSASECRSSNGCSSCCHIVDNLLAQRLEINTMRCLYEDENDEFDVCTNCKFDNWYPESPTMSGWYMDFIRNAPPDCSSLSETDYRDYVSDSIKDHSNARYYAYWSTGSNHASNINIVGPSEFIGYTDCTCSSDTIIPVHSVYESIGIIVHNMTGIEQIRSNLLDYDIAHLQLFYIVDFIAAIKIPFMINGFDEQNVDILRYSLFVEHILQNCICKNVETLITMNRVGRSKYVFMIHPEIELKAAEAATHLVLFGAE